MFESGGVSDRHHGASRENGTVNPYDFDFGA